MQTKVMMLETRPGSENGYDVKHYVKGRHYMVGDFLLETFILDGCVKIIDENNDGFIEPIDTVSKVITVNPNDTQKRGRGRPRKT